MNHATHHNKWKVWTYNHKFQYNQNSCGVYICYWTYLLCTGLAKKTPRWDDRNMDEFRLIMRNFFNSFSEVYFKRKSEVPTFEDKCLLIPRGNNTSYLPRIPYQNITHTSIPSHKAISDLSERLQEFTKFEEHWLMARIYNWRPCHCSPSSLWLALYWYYCVGEPQGSICKCGKVFCKVYEVSRWTSYINSLCKCF